MAFGATVQSASSTAASGALTSPTLSGGATAGNLLVFRAVRSSTHGSGGAWPTVSGYTLIYATGINTGNMAAAWWAKLASGGETTVSLSGETNASGNWTASLAEYEGSFAAGTADVKAENTANLASTTSSISTGTTGSTSASSALALTLFGIDAGSSFGTRQYTNSFAEDVLVTSGGRAAHVTAKKVLSATGAQETTLSYSAGGTADEMYGSIAVFLAEAVGDPPGTPTLESPADEGTVTSSTPVLTFNAVDPDADDVRYQIQISNNSAFTGGGVNLTFEHNAGTGVVHPNPTGGTVSNGTSADGDPQLDDRPGRTIPMGGGFLDAVALLVGRDETDTDGSLRVRAYDIDGTPGTDAEPAGATAGSATPTAGWRAISDDIPLDNTMAETPAWRTHDFTGANRIQTLSSTVMMFIADWLAAATSPNTNTVTIQVGDCESGHNGWIDGNSANYGVRAFGPKIRVYEEQTLIDALSGTDDGFANTENGGDTDPFNSGDTIGYTVQAGDALEDGRTYYWRVRAIDPSGSGVFSAWTTARSFTVDTSIDVSDGTADGTSTAAATGSSLADTDGTGAGTSTASATGSSLVAAVGTAAGSATAAATGASLADANASADGTSTASATASQDESTGTAAGTSTASAAGSSLATTAGTAAGTATASATASSLSTASGTAAGSATASATGSSLADADATASGTSTASAVSGQTSSGTAAGTSTASATASALSDATATAAGVATATATGSSLASASGTAAATSTATAIGSSLGGLIPQTITISAQTWATPQITQQAWYAATVTNETWAPEDAA
jgi:hypothetical protein